VAEPTLRIAAVSIDCADPDELAGFYATLLNGEIAWSTATAAGVRSGGWILALQKVNGYEPPTWPGSSILHLDLNGDAPVDELVAVALAAGARLADHQPDPRWSVLLDPAGHPLCITPYAPPG
jgi:hypothetical protein